MKNIGQKITEKLIKKAQEGDQLAYTSIYNKTKGVLMHYAYDNEEVVNNAYTKLWNVRDRWITNPQTFLNYMIIITKNYAYSNWRQMDKKKYVHFHKKIGDDGKKCYEEKIKTISNQEEEEFSNYKIDMIWEIYENLKIRQDHREIFDLFYKEGYSIKKIAEDKNICWDTIKVTIKRIRDKIIIEILENREKYEN